MCKKPVYCVAGWAICFCGLLRQGLRYNCELVLNPLPSRDPLAYRQGAFPPRTEMPAAPLELHTA